MFLESVPMHVLSGLLDYSITRPSARRSNLTSTSHQHDEIGKCRSHPHKHKQEGRESFRIGFSARESGSSYFVSTVREAFVGVRVHTKRHFFHNSKECH